jgi:ABC-2 type transport system permease protein
MKSYSNFRATMAIAKASFRSIIRSPSAVVFSLAFPLIFITVFANIGDSAVAVDVGVAKTCDTSNMIYRVLKTIKVVHLITNETDAELAKNLKKASIDVVLNIQKNAGKPPYTINVQYTKASKQKGGLFKSVMSSILYQLNTFGATAPPAVADMKETTTQGRVSKYIDFILPGMLGFSLLSSGVFGTAFVFLSLRITLVLKRFLPHQ